MDDTLLIETVRNRSVLYDKGHEGFKNPALKKSAWLSIAEVMKASAAACITRWNNLRERYAREKRLEKSETRSGAGSPNRTPWVYWSDMNFLYHHVRVRKSIDNFPQRTSGISGTSGTSGTSSSCVSLTFADSPIQSTSSSTEDDLEMLLQADSADDPTSIEFNNAHPSNMRILASCPPVMPPTSAVNVDSAKSAAASLPYFGPAGRCKLEKPDKTMEMFKETLSNLRESMRAPASQTSTASGSDPDDLIGRSVTACLKNLTDKRTKIRYRKMFRDLVKDCEEAILEDE